MDAFSAGLLCRTIDPFHSASYFVPETEEKFGALGMDNRMRYFASRSAPMGAVSAGVVAATFYNFNPELVAAKIPAAWQIASPAAVTRMRYEIVEEAMPRVLGEQLAGSSELARGAVILRRAAESIPDGDGRPLYAAHAELPWPQSVCGQLWHAVTLLREYRGDGHIAALIAHELGGLEALITHSAAGIGFTNDFARRLRGWSAEQWDAGVDRLRDRGLLDAAGKLTPLGDDVRSRIEDLTDDLAYQPWRTIPDDQADELRRLARAVRAAVLSAGVLPAAGLGPRFGEHR
ncbi:SCO6745 family protein [Mycobacterium sp.]|uniref:SCO6745 family protein n=1 Tax=Mycobacterium sp. TaxID=1785 RepID=UPI002D36AD2C|nr:hypothetical protein [Mycobacterium sp.]HZA09865.1 hypothetical protein [Mycobacterium sp.]